MAGNRIHRFAVNQKDVVKLVSTTIDSFIRDRLIDKDERTRHREQCAERLAAGDGKGGESGDEEEELRYSDQAVLANLDWGIEALEEALGTSHMETKLVRLDHAEKMLRVCAMLSSDQKTAGVPNFYLSAWAHLHLAYLWKLRNDVQNSVTHVLEMFIIDPYFSPVYFAPELWKDLFLPHMGSVIEWYSDERHGGFMEAIPNSSNLSSTIDVGRSFDESLVLGPDEVDKLRKLEQLFGESLDENSRLFAKYFKDCLNSDSNSGRKVGPMMPIAEPPTIPDFVTVGPTLPMSVGFSSPVNSRNRSAGNVVSPASTRWDPEEGLPEGNEEESYYGEQELSIDVDFDESYKTKSTIHSPPTVFSPLCSPKASHNRNHPITLLRLKSIRSTHSPTATSLPLSPSISTNTSDDGAEGMSQSCSRPPKDFVCPITGQIFVDPVTLETGQTYEKRAIREWLKRGNETCPITRQLLSASELPKTNYVLKRLIASWREQHHEFQSCTIDSGSFESPMISVISQSQVEKIKNSLKPHVSCLCTSETLRECEAAVLEIARLWKDSNRDPGVRCFLSDPTIVNGFVEILNASLDRHILRASIYVLSELISEDEEEIGGVLKSVDSDLDCLVALLKNGLVEAAILICQLRPTFARLFTHDLVPCLVQLMHSKYADEPGKLEFVMGPKHAVIALLEYILVEGDEKNRSIIASSLISENGIPILVKLLDGVDERRSIVSILLCCMQAEKSCGGLIANNGVELSLVLELFYAGDDSVKGICVRFLLELVRLNRKTLSNQILQTIKDEGKFSSMHTFLVYLQMAPMEQKPVIASLLLQLDLLVEPRKMSIYREEAIEALIEALRSKHLPDSQFTALDVLSSLIGRTTTSGDSYTKAWLLKIAGFDQPYNALIKAEKLLKHEADPTKTMEEEEEKAISSWEKRLAFVLSNHEKGSIFEALEECMRSSSLEMANESLVVATWLTYMISILPDTGVKTAARKFLLDKFINVLQSSNNHEEKILVTLALKTFINNPDATRTLGVYAKCIYKTLRKLKRNSVVVSDILKALRNLTSVDMTELWSCTKLAELDACTNGEVLSLIHLRGRVLSSHSDGTIKVWEVGKRIPRMVQEVREHSKAVTCLYASPSGDKLYSGSLDKTIRVWTVKPEEIRCVQVHDVKEAVNDLAADSKTVCFVSEGTGVKVYDWSGTPKHVNFNKYVKCVAMSGNKLYCGCSGYSIQEVDLRSYTTSTFYSGTRKLLGKQTIHSLRICDGILFVGGSSVDSTAGKIFLLSTKAIIGSFSTGLDIQRIHINDDFIFTATKCGNTEVWLKDRFTKVASIKMSSNGHSKITSLASDANVGMLYAGSSDGKIQVWNLD